ncbi:dynein regulatory complex protein 9 [Drosophila kikkawai]|uniref:Dynein regulatory complex protein 9 n=1 Tax=Drosophila kikkawai TaxID=30033 RepID=A0A6P4JHH5_DROKI|nr:dynein regulatory complex protein 9 [Drosophila kikkawai]
MTEAHTEEQLLELRRILLLTVYKNTLNQLVLQQRSQRLNARKPLSLPASLRRRRSSSLGEQEKPDRILITGKVLPRLESLLGETEDDADQLDEDVLDALKFERDMDALRAIYEVAMDDEELKERKIISVDGKELETGKEEIASKDPDLEIVQGKDDSDEPKSQKSFKILEFNVLESQPIDVEKSKFVEGEDLDAPQPQIESQETTHEEDRSLQKLKQAIAALGGNKSEVSQAAQQLQESKDELKKLKEDLDTEKRVTKDKLLDLEDRIAETKYKLRCVSRVNDLEYSLVQRWEEGRLAQGTIWGENAERAYLRDILDIKQKLAREERVSTELRSFRQQEIVDLHRRIVEWQERYVSEMRRVDREAESWELRILEQKKQLERHREIYEERMIFVQEYRAQKAEEQRLHDLQVHRIECAVRLQAWWRGTMVRRGLGPFKKKPKRGKRGKPKK